MAKLKITLDVDERMSDYRNLVLHISSQIETAVSDLLCLSIGDFETKSKSFGFTSEALSFNAKINLLMDFQIFNKNHKVLFQKFTEIRNKFAHNFKVSSFSWFSENPEGSEVLKYLIKNYSNHKNPENEISMEMFLKMVKEIEDCLNIFYNHILRRTLEIGEYEYRTKFYNIVLDVFSDVTFHKTISMNNSTDVVIELHKEINKRLDSNKDSPDKIREILQTKKLF